MPEWFQHSASTLRTIAVYSSEFGTRGACVLAEWTSAASTSCTNVRRTSGSIGLSEVQSNWIIQHCLRLNTSKLRNMRFISRITDVFTMCKCQFSKMYYLIVNYSWIFFLQQLRPWFWPWGWSPWPWPWELWPWPWPWGLCPWPCLGLGGYVLVNITAFILNTIYTNIK